jgi:hypothetical protein
MTARLPVLAWFVLHGWSALAQAQDAAPIRVMIGSIVSAVKQDTKKDEADPLQSIGSGSLAGAIQVKGSLALEVYADSDEQFQVYQMIADDQRRNLQLNPATVRKLREKKFDYFVFVKYWPDNSSNTHIQAVLGQVGEDDRVKLLHAPVETVTPRNAPDFRHLGEQLYDELLKHRGKTPRQRLPFVFCEFEWASGSVEKQESDFIIGTIRSGIMGNLDVWRQWYVREVKEGSCTVAAGVPMISVSGKIRKFQDTISFEIVIKCGDAIVGMREKHVNMKEIMNDPEATLKSVAEALRLQCENWSPPL